MEERILKINQVVREYFEKHPEIEKVPAKELMPEFIKAGIYLNNHRDGLPIRNDLRELDRNDSLDRITNAFPERKLVNTKWYFIGNKDDNEVTAYACKLHDLITGELHKASGKHKLRYPLRIDRYQRPYVWSNSKVMQLLQDLKQHKEGAYYLGSILLHEYDKKEGLFVIDGQQRLTTLTLLYRYLFPDSVDPENMKLSYYHRESVENIRDANNIIGDELDDESVKVKIRSNLKELEATIIITNDIDLAFTFFDSQNSRGVRLRSTDLLKSYHLREINQIRNQNPEDRQYLERNSAKRWEHLQTFKGVLSNEHDFAFELFHKLIWRARRWKGDSVEKENRDTVIEEFQDHTVEGRSGEIPLYPNRQNMLSEYLIESKHEGLRRSGSHIKLTEKSSHLPFTLRQPIYSGLHYFLFAEKYAELIFELFHEETLNKVFIDFRNYVDTIVDENSYYLKELFLVCVVVYYEKFGTAKLLKFVEYLGLAHGVKRLEQYYIFRQSILKYVREYNLIDVITYSFRPEEVIDSLKNHIIPDKKERITSHVDLTDEDSDGVLDKSGVNERCCNAFQKYYDLNLNDLTGQNKRELDLTEFSKVVIGSIKGVDNE